MDEKQWVRDMVARYKPGFAKRPKRGRPKKEERRALPLIEFLDNLPPGTNFMENLKDILRLKGEKDAWKGLMATPPGSLLETVIGAFQRRTDIPLEIPFFTTLSYVSAYLLNQGIQIEIGGRLLPPTLWTVILAPSGAGKTFASSTIKEAIQRTSGLEDTPSFRSFTTPASAAKFVQELSETNNSLWIKDEFGQYLRSIDQQPHMAEIKEILLDTYGHSTVTRSTKKEQYVIERPALSILGLTVDSTFRDQVGIESMVDGFGQRFNYVNAPSDPQRRMEDFPLYEMGHEIPIISEAWKRLGNVALNPCYKMGPNGMEAFKHSFYLLRKDNEDLDASFFRRAMFTAVRYGLIYHILLGKETDEIDAEDMAWAGRLVAMHMQETRVILSDYGMSELENLVLRAEELREKALGQGVEFTPRYFVQRERKVKTVRIAKEVMSLMSPRRKP